MNLLLRSSDNSGNLQQGPEKEENRGSLVPTAKPALPSLSRVVVGETAPSAKSHPVPPSRRKVDESPREHDRGRRGQ